MGKDTSTAARVILTIVALVTGLAPFIADFNETHVYNPFWPGHARFHNAQTMSMGAFLGLTTLWKTWATSDAADDRLRTASVLAAGYYLTMLAAWFFPGVTGWDPPQHSELVFPQFNFVIVPMLSLVAVAFGLEQRAAWTAKGKVA